MRTLDAYANATTVEQALVALAELPGPLGRVGVALLAADFAEHVANNAISLRCVAAVRAWAARPCEATVQECRDAANAACAPGAADAAYYAAAKAAYATAAYAAYVTTAADAAYYAAAYAASKRTEERWQLTHIRTKHPLCEL